ncbi:Sorting nexin-3 [Saitoella coloradoensis]
MQPVPRGFDENSRPQMRQMPMDELYGVPENFLEIEVCLVLAELENGMEGAKCA